MRGYRMTDQEILRKAIELAENNGWKRPAYLTFVNSKGDFYFPLGTSEDIVVSTFSIKTLLLDHDFAKALWGEYHSMTTHDHITRSTMPGYVDTTHPLHNSEDIKMVMNEDMKCFSCGKVLNSNYSINHTICWKEGDYNVGWISHLQIMVIAEDPIKYLRENI